MNLETSQRPEESLALENVPPALKLYSSPANNQIIPR